MVCGVREIVVYPLPSQLQESFIVPCVFRRTVWGIRKLIVKELASDMDIPQVNALEALVLDSVSDDEVMSRFLELPPVKALQYFWR